VFDPADERPPGGGDLHTFEFWSPRASFGGHLALWRRPAQGSAWYTTAVFREGEPVVALADEFPLRATLELRGNGLWADHNLEDPFVHWSVGLEAFALLLDDPADERGERVPLGYDLEWEMDRAVIAPLDGGYEQPARVHGEVLLGTDAYDLDGWGWRSHVHRAAIPYGLVRHHGGDPAAPRWTAEAGPEGSDEIGWSLAVLPQGTLRKALYRSTVTGASGAGGGDGADVGAGFTERWGELP
jgi:hypothetical protein